MDDKPSVVAEEQMAADDDNFGFGPDGLEDWTPVGGDELTIGEILKYPVADESAESASEVPPAEIASVSGLGDGGWASVEEERLDLSMILDDMDEAAEAALSEDDVAVVGTEGDAGASHTEPCAGYTVVSDGDGSTGTDFDPSLS